MAWIFEAGEANTAERCRSIGRGFQRYQARKDSQAAEENADMREHKTNHLSLFFSVWAASQNPNGARTASEPTPCPTRKLQRSSDSI